MSDQSILIGRDELFRLVRECVPWKKSELLPIVVLIGSAGSGKTAALRGVREISANLHCAHIDVAAQGFRTPAQVMTALALQLSYKRRGLRRLAFSRFLIGRLATQVDLKGRNPDADRAAMRAFIDSLRGRRLSPETRALAAKVGDIVGPWFGLPALPGAADLALGAVDTALFRFRRPAGLAWWGSGPRRQLDELLELHRMVNKGTPDERQAAEQRLAHAFLTDLRESYAGNLLTSPTEVAAVVTLDNAHTRAGQLALGLIAQVRNRTGPDPLLVIAGCGRKPDRLGLGDQPSDERLEVAAWRAAVRDGRSETQFLPIDLRALTSDEVQEWGRRLGRHDFTALAAAHRLTAGHPGGLAELLPAEPFGQYRAALARKDDSGRRQADVLLEALLPSASSRLVAELTTCAAVPRLVSSDIQVALGRDNADRADHLRRELTARLWLSPGDTMHPWLRQLLLLSLQARSSSHPQSWTRVHSRLRAHRAATGDHTGAAYHLLASNDHEPVVQDLIGGVAQADAQWFTALRRITAAPRSSSDTDAEAFATPHQAAGGVDRTAIALTRLVAGMWLAGDPLNAAASDACDVVVSAATELALLTPRSADSFFALAEEYRRKVTP